MALSFPDPRTEKGELNDANLNGLMIFHCSIAVLMHSFLTFEYKYCTLQLRQEK